MDAEGAELGLVGEMGDFDEGEGGGWSSDDWTRTADAGRDDELANLDYADPEHLP